MTKKLYANIEVGEESDLLTKQELLDMIASEFNRVEGQPERLSETELGYTITYEWLTDEEYKELKHL